MKWFEHKEIERLSRHVWSRIRFWWKFPNREERAKLIREAILYAEEALNDKVRKDKWLSEYDKRPEKPIRELGDELISEIRKGKK